MDLNTQNEILPIEIISIISTYLNIPDFITLLNVCSYYKKNKEYIIKVQTNLMLNFLNITVNELDIIGLYSNYNYNHNYMGLFKHVRNFLYKSPPKVMTTVSRHGRNKTEFYNVEAYIISSTLYNKFMPGIFPDGYPLYIRTNNIKYFYNLITQLRNKTQFNVTFFATIKDLSIGFVPSLLIGKTFTLHNIKNDTRIGLNYLDAMSYLQLCIPISDKINDIHVFTLYDCNTELNIYYSSINECENRKDKLLRVISDVYASTYLVTDKFE